MNKHKVYHIDNFTEMPDMIDRLIEAIYSLDEDADLTGAPTSIKELVDPEGLLVEKLKDLRDFCYEGVEEWTD
jgi:hypothetical protein